MYCGGNKENSQSPESLQKKHLKILDIMFLEFKTLFSTSNIISLLSRLRCNWFLTE